PPDAVGPGDVEVGTVVLVQRLLHDVIDAERGLEAAHAQAPGRLRRAVFEVGLVNGGLAVLQARPPGRVGPQPELVVALLRVQARSHAAAGMPAAAQVPAQAEAGTGADAVGVAGGATAGPGFGADVAEAEIAAGLPGVLRLGAAGGQCKREHDRDGTLQGGRGPATRWGGIRGHRDHLTTRPVTIRTARVCPPVPAATLTWLRQAAMASAAERACTCADATGASRRRPQCHGTRLGWRNRAGRATTRRPQVWSGWRSSHFASRWR